jgi:hypothetical protein
MGPRAGWAGASRARAGASRARAGACRARAGASRARAEPLKVPGGLLNFLRGERIPDSAVPTGQRESASMPQRSKQALKSFPSSKIPFEFSRWPEETIGQVSQLAPPCVDSPCSRNTLLAPARACPGLLAHCSRRPTPTRPLPAPCSSLPSLATGTFGGLSPPLVVGFLGPG